MFCKSITILFCTANVQQFQDPNSSDILPTLRHLSEPDDDIIIFGFQESNLVDETFFQEQLPGYEIYGGHFFSNTLAVYTKQKIEKSVDIIPISSSHFVVDRYATVLHFPTLNLKVTTTHLTGGRYDDRIWYKVIDQREEQMKTILNHHPNVIMGDFNADCHFDVQPLNDYWKHLVERKGKVEDVVRYNTGVHTLLQNSEYHSVIPREEIRSTSFFGNVVDWIYVSPWTNHEVVEKGVIRAISQQLSDHDFPWVRVKINLS